MLLGDWGRGGGGGNRVVRGVVDVNDGSVR